MGEAAGHVRPGGPRPAHVDPGQHGAFQIGAFQVRPAHVGPLQDRAGEIGLLEIGAGQDRPAQGTVGKVGGVGRGFGQMGAVQARAGQDRMVDLAATGLVTHRVQPLAGVGDGNLADAEVGLLEIGVGEVRALQAGPAHVRPRQHRLAKVGLAQITAEQGGPLQLGPDHPRAIERGAGEVGVVEIPARQVQARHVHEVQGKPLAPWPAGAQPLMRLDHHIQLALSEATATGEDLSRVHGCGVGFA